MPSVRPSRSRPIVVCHGAPAFMPGVLEADAAGELQHQAEGDAGGRAADGAGAADRDAALGAGFDVE